MIKKNGGFTLIEFVIVASILGLLPAIAIPKYIDSIEFLVIATQFIDFFKGKIC